MKPRRRLYCRRIVRMMRKLLYISALVFLAVLTGCADRERVSARLDALDSLVVEHPDSVLSVLESMQGPVEDEKESVRKHYQLLCMKADFLVYEFPQNDSIVLSVLHYYESHPDKYLTAEAYHYTGRTYEYLGDALQAMDYYKQVLEMLPEDLEDRRSVFLRGCASSHMGTLLFKQGMYEQALTCYQMVYKYDKLLHHKSLLVCDERDLGDTYYALNQKDSALYYYDKAEQTALSLGDTVSLNNVRFMRAIYHRNEGNYQKALELNRALLSRVNSTNGEGVYYLQGELYLRLHQLDSSRVYFRKVMELPHTAPVAKENASKALGEIALREGRLKDAVSHFNDYIYYSDSTDRAQKKEAIMKAYELYSYNLRERENQRLSLENERKTLLVVILSLLLLLTGVVFVAIYRHLMDRQARSRLQIARLRRWNEEKERASQEFIDNNLQKIRDLELQLQSSESEKEQYRLSLQAQIEKLQGQNRKAVLRQEEKERQWNEVLQSDTYRFLLSELKSGQIVRDSVWQDVESMVNEIYDGFITQLRESISLNSMEKQVVLLTKLQFSPSDIAVLVGRGKSSITMLRQRLYFKIFGTEGKSKDLDSYLLSL